MTFSYYTILTISYLVALGVWWLLSKKYSDTLIHTETVPAKKPWIQTGLVLLCAVATVLIGRLYASGYLFPDFKIGTLRVGESLNQVLIYSPFPLYVLITKQSLSSVWLPSHNWKMRLLLGLALSLVALVSFVLLSDKKSLWEVLRNVYHVQNTHHAVQIFFEDFAIALLLSRLSAALTAKYFGWAILVVAILFPLGHLPGNLDAGIPLLQALASLSIDAALVFTVGIALYKSKDFLWFFPIHFAMDMMQFHSGLTI
jgi:hypothetical protein